MEFLRRLLDIKNKGNDKEITLEYLFSNNNISKNACIMTEFTLKKVVEYNNTRIESEMIKYFDYRNSNYNGKEVKSIANLPPFNEFQPDRKFDLKSSVKIDITPGENNGEEDNSEEMSGKELKA